MPFPTSAEQPSPAQGLCFVWHQSTGEMRLNDELIGKGWAGNGRGKNNPAMQGEKGVGPLPRGFYTIGPAQDHPDSVGAYAMALKPDPSNGMYGRDGFYIHGPSQAHYGQESHGCIVLMRPVREQINLSNIRRLQVVA